MTCGVLRTSCRQSKTSADTPKKGMMRQTLYDKIWSDHVVVEEPDGTCLLYVDRHIVHEVDSPQAFAGLRRAGLGAGSRKTLLVVDHNVPTSDRSKPNPDPESARLQSPISPGAGAVRPRILQRIRPAAGHLPCGRTEQGFTLPGTVIVCGDSHTGLSCVRGPQRYRHFRGRARAPSPDADPASRRTCE